MTSRFAKIAAFFILALPMCSGHVGAPDIRARGHAGAAQGALAASQDAPTALSGRVIPADGGVTGTRIGAAIPGEASVSSDGSTSYKIPIWVPEGIRGLKPSLAITYESHGGFGLLGRRWGISGLSSIRRCQKTRAQDGAAAPLHYGGTEFCLDGERLLLTSSGTVSSEYRTEKNPYAKIVAESSASTGASSFQVFQPDGTIYYYGRTVASRLQATLPQSPDVLSIAAYYLDKIEDRFGNSILISYSAPIQYGSEVDQLIPKLIQWGGTGDEPGQRSIEFDYVEGAPAGVNHEHWMGGLGILGGARLDHLVISGPDGFSNVIVLKKYEFKYQTPTITGEPLLYSINECDAADVCKKGTTITWEPGSWEYTATNLSTLGVNDVVLPASAGVDPQMYRRIMAVDLNHDGRDDIVYRAFIQAQTSGTDSCLGWAARLAQPDGTFGSPIQFWGLGADPDPKCTDAATKLGPGPEDLIFADVNRDGFPDILSPVNDMTASSGGNLQQFSYGAYLNSAIAGNTFEFGDRIGFEDAYLTHSSDDWWCYYSGGSVKGANPSIAVGDIDGDGYPEILRPNYYSFLFCDDGYPPYGGVSSFSIRGSSASATSSVSFVPPALEDSSHGGSWPVNAVSMLDIDNDGTAEVIFDGTDEGFNTGPYPFTRVTSPTMNGDFAFPFARSGSTHWILDLNGDGLKDAVVVNASDPGTIVPYINTGNGFSMTQSTTLPDGAQIGHAWQNGTDPGVRVVDYNLDGRQDLVLVGGGVYSDGTKSPIQKVLLSDGTGKFTLLDTPLLKSALYTGDPASGYGAPSSPQPTDLGYRTSVVLDVNGDGLPDFLQVENGQLMLHTRKGKMPDVVTRILEGTGRTIDIAYAPATDGTVYTPDPSLCANATDHLDCLAGGRLLTQSLRISGAGTNIDKKQTFKYAGGVIDRGGRGFLGFERREIYGPASQHVTEYMSPAQRKTITSISLANTTWTYDFMYTYLGAFRPYLVVTQVDAPTALGANSHHVTYHWSYTQYAAQTPGVLQTTYTLMPSYDEEDVYDCPVGPGDGSGTVCAGDMRMLSSTVRTRNFDSFGNLTSDVTQHYDANWALVQTDDEEQTYAPDSTGSWLVRQLQKKQITSSTPTESVTRTTTYTYDLSFNAASGYPLGALKTIATEETGDPSVHLLRTLGYDDRGRLNSVADSAGFPTSTECSNNCSPTCNYVCDSDCAGAGAGEGACMAACMGSCMGSCITTCMATPSETRTTTYQYDGDNADGVYVTKTINAAGTTRVWRHPGLGLVVETDDPNGAASASTYDSFGRVLAETSATGASTTTTYDDLPPGAPSFSSGADYHVHPAGEAIRTIDIHLDAFGNETSRVAPVDGTRKLTTNRSYDSLGRFAGTKTFSSTSTDPIAYEDLTYDDMNRVLQDCRLSSADNARHCKTNGYDGLEVYLQDETGRERWRFLDVMGRIAVDEAYVPLVAGNAPVKTDTTFTYGPFGVLEHEATSDGSGSTDMTYDVLGRRTSLVRGGIFMPLIETYDAYGELRTMYKLNPVSGDHFETQTFAYDALGRVTSQTSTGYGTGPGVPPALNRHYYWDTTPDGTVLPNGIGRLNDVVDFNSNVSIHFDYAAGGQPLKKTWTIFNPAVGASEKWVAQFTYDGQGRLDTLTYPQAPNDTAPLSLQYAYDPYLGVPSSITRLEGPTNETIWSVTARNALGVPTTESMMFGGGPTITRSTDYYLQDGHVQDATLASSASGSTPVQMSYTYDAHGRAKSFGTAFGWDTTSEVYDYDNLGRLISWDPSWGYAIVSYGYDADGNMTSRSWSTWGAGESVSYSTSPDGSARTMSITDVVLPAYSETYKIDGYGRVWDTPAVSIWTTDDDKPGVVTEKATGQVDTVVYDGNGRRVLTLYGTNGSAGTLLTLDDMFELKRAGGSTEARYRLRAGDELIGDVVKDGGDARTATFYLENNVHSVVGEASSTGAVSRLPMRDPYGNVIGDNWNPSLPRNSGGIEPEGTERLGFGGHERDPDWGMVDMLARAYSPRLGRFMGPDPVIADTSDRRSYNPFAYVRNNPVSGYDPLGMADLMSYSSMSVDPSSYGYYSEETALASTAADDPLMSVDDRAPLCAVDDDPGAAAPNMSIDDGAGGMADELSSPDYRVPSTGVGATDLLNDMGTPPSNPVELQPYDYVRQSESHDGGFRTRLGFGLSWGPLSVFAGVSIDSTFDLSLVGEGSLRLKTGMFSAIPSAKFGDLRSGYNEDGFRLSEGIKGNLGYLSDSAVPGLAERLPNEALPYIGAQPLVLDFSPGMLGDVVKENGDLLVPRNGIGAEVKVEGDFSITGWTFNNIFWPAVQPMFDDLGIPSRNAQ